MLVIQILLILIAGFILLLILVRIFAPTFLILPWSWFMKLLVKNPPVLDKDVYFPEHELLQKNWPRIREELMTVLQSRGQIPMLQQVDPFQAVFAFKDQIPWRTFIFNAMGNWVEENCRQAPYTASLLKQIPGVCNALFSIMEGNKYIPPHKGFNKSFVRYHLALLVPPDAPSYLIAGDHQHFYKEGEDIMFDDTWRHEARNESASPRVVLFVDVLRSRNLPGWLSRWNESFFHFCSRQDRVKAATKKAIVIQAPS